VDEGRASRSDTPEAIGYNYSYNEEGGLLPMGLEAWSGIDSDDRQKLMDMNDDGRRSFSEIADWIDANL
jgi:hypothetical protein